MSTPTSPKPAEADERQPLLTPQARAEQQDAVPGDLNGSLGEPEGNSRPKTTRGQIAWYIFWTLMGIFVLVVFVKGWIDSKDVNVRKDWGVPLGHWC